MRYLSAYSIVIAEIDAFFQVLFYLGNDRVELLYRLGCLRKEYYLTREVYLVQVAFVFYYDVGVSYLPFEPDYLGLPLFPDYHYLCVGRLFVCFADFLLQGEHHSARGIYYGYVVTPSDVVYLGRFAVSTEQYFGVF